MWIPFTVGDMQVDLGNSLGVVADPGISREALERLDGQVSSAHARISDGMRSNSFGYAALNLPERTDVSTITDTITGVMDSSFVLTIGIGGSALGATMLMDALGSGDAHVALDNVDPVHIERVLSEIDFNETAVHVVSKSGSTIETMANFHVVIDAFEAAGVDWTNRTIVTTGKSGVLREIAEAHSLPTLSVPKNVPGRFAALSPVGLVPPAILGHDIEAVLSGAADTVSAMNGSLFSTPAYAYAAAMTGLSRRGVSINAMMPYAESLESFAEWFSQLWAESLGKDGFGQLPARALGVTDQHSQLQLYRAGPRNMVVTFLRAQQPSGPVIPPIQGSGFKFLEEVRVGELLDAEFSATEASLAAVSRPSVRIDIDSIDAENMGRLVVAMEAACVMVAELQGVDPFTQPGVEWGKEATRSILGSDDVEQSVALDGKASLLVSE